MICKICGSKTKKHINRCGAIQMYVFFMNGRPHLTGIGKKKFGSLALWIDRKEHYEKKINKTIDI